jgi:hypothetical protein
LIAAAPADPAGSAGLATFDLSRFTIDSGGVNGATGGGFELSATIGQPDAVVLSGGGLTLAGGFWFGQSPGDANEDGGVDLFDYRELERCASGPESTPIPPACAPFDVDGDHDIDLKDISEFQRTFRGS